MQRVRTACAALWDGLFDVHQPPVRYLAKALLLDLPVSTLLVILIGLAFPQGAPDFSHLSVGMMLPILCIAAPLLETVLMAVLFLLLRLVTHRTAYRAMLSTLIWMGFHSLGAPAHGLGISWFFLILSICYLRWESRSVGHALGMTAALHALHNLPFALLLLAGKMQ